MPQLRKRGDGVAVASADCVSVPAHIVSPATKDALSLKSTYQQMQMNILVI